MPSFMEPFRIKAVEPIPFPSTAERAETLAAAGYNLFRVPSRRITIDLLTDSGTAAMSAAQWSALLSGDESSGGALSFERFQHVVRELTGCPEVLPVHQGRAAERILLHAVLGLGDICVGNTHSDSTRASVEAAGAEAIDLPVPEGVFGGDLDLDALAALLDGVAGDRVRCVVLAVTDNADGGQPVSMLNIARARKLCDTHGVPLYLDASRFAENAYLISDREAGFSAMTPREIARAMFELADGCWANLKKDGLANVGGLLALRDEELAARCVEQLVTVEGLSIHGGLAGRDLEALAQGLLEVTDREYLRYRAESARWFGEQLALAGLPVLQPTGCHAVYVDAGALLDHLPPQHLPATAFANELYLAGGVRVSERGTLASGKPVPDGANPPARRELVRFALPGRVYTVSHLEYVVDVAEEVRGRARHLSGYRITRSHGALRQFTAVLERR